METQAEKSGVLAVVCSFNRTSLEWKLMILWVILQLCFLLIEPFWDGNTILATEFQAWLPSFNRTILGWKQELYAESSIFILRLLIEPVWNGNSSRPLSSDQSLLLLIEPFWNGNGNRLIDTHHALCLLIEPFWNGNVTCIPLWKLYV